MFLNWDGFEDSRVQSSRILNFSSMIYDRHGEDIISIAINHTYLTLTPLQLLKTRVWV